MKIVNFIKNNLNIMLMITILVLVVLIFRRILREGVENDLSTGKDEYEDPSRFNDAHFGETGSAWIKMKGNKCTDTTKCASDGPD